ncbi:Isopentenyl-diphosphate Delta-isomerase I [Coccomyxa sp. Obi]|nr:Isopentenyl-diphosphate Delta-isomerase I [Coccomyxa sp. Obi]
MLRTREAWRALLHSSTHRGFLPRTAAQHRCFPMVATPLHQAGRWDGSGSQADLMQKDECILVDEQDNIVGSANKYRSHQFTRTQPQGLLHRAFSVFLFNHDNKLLLQQRALSKITFPGVWTNTCCSHPLHGHTPTEVDEPGDIANGSVMGAKRAAVRKLEHELGIVPQELPLTDFHFLTRLHYCAADTDTYGPDAEWGEHEVDYILFIKAAVSLKANPEEVEDTRYVTLPELRDMMAPSSPLRWSPWFRIIAENFLEEWWSNLDKAISTDAYLDVKSIHKIL